MSSIFQVITVCFWRVTITTLRDSTYFFEVRFFFCGGKFPAHNYVSAMNRANFFFLEALIGDVQKRSIFSDPLGWFGEQKKRRHFLGLKDPLAVLWQLLDFIWPFTFVVWKSFFFWIRPSWKVIPEKIGLRTSFLPHIKQGSSNYPIWGGSNNGDVW